MHVSARVVDTPISRRMRSASAFWPPVKAAMARICAATASARATFMARTVRMARTARLTLRERDLVAGSGISTRTRMKLPQRRWEIAQSDTGQCLRYGLGRSLRQPLYADAFLPLASLHGRSAACVAAQRAVT